MIGVNLPLCIASILRGEVEIGNVKKIIAATRASSQADWNTVIESYRNEYWSENPDEGERLVRLLLEESRIEQPRLTNSIHFPLCWRGNQQIWVHKEEEIRWFN